MTRFVLFLFITLTSFTITTMASAPDSKKDPQPLTTEFEVKQSLSTRYMHHVVEAFKVLNQTCVYPKPGHKYVIPTSWSGPRETARLPGGKTVYTSNLYVKKDVSPYDAVQRFFTKPKTRPHWVLDCRLSMGVAQAYALSQLLGKEVFDEWFSKTPQHLEHQTAKFHTITFSKSTAFYTQKTIGTLGYITNLSMYRNLIGGPGNGYNILLCGQNKKGENLYTGFDAVFKDGPCTYAQLRSSLLHDLLNSPVNESNFLRMVVNPIIQEKLKKSFEENPKELEEQFDVEQIKNPMSRVFCILNEKALTTAIAESEKKKKMESASSTKK